MRRFTTTTIIAVLLAFSGMALAQTPGAGQEQGQMGQGKMMKHMPKMMDKLSQGMLSIKDQKKMADMMRSYPMVKMMEQMSKGKLSPEDQKKMAEMIKSCPMMKMTEQQQIPEQPKK